MKYRTTILSLTQNKWEILPNMMSLAFPEYKILLHVGTSFSWLLSFQLNIHVSYFLYVVLGIINKSVSRLKRIKISSRSLIFKSY